MLLSNPMYGEVGKIWRGDSRN